MIAPAAKDRLERLFHPVAPANILLKSTIKGSGTALMTYDMSGNQIPPPRPCGCRTWFQTIKECPYCKARILRGRIEK